MIEALIFDFDGLILDTELPEFRSWQAVYEAHGCALSRDAWCTGIGGVGLFDPYAHLERLTGRSIDREAVRAARRPRYHELLETERVLPGVERYLADAARLGLQVAVASSSSHAWVAGHLGRLGLFERFTSVHCHDEGTPAKPDPALYHAALRSLGVGPEQAVAFEDSAHGATAAKRAGIFCVAVPNELTRGLDLSHADLRLESLEQVRLEDLLRTVASVRRHLGGEVTKTHVER